MKIGFVSIPLTGHLNPMTALARKLKARGHEVVFIGFPDIAPVVRAAGLDFVPCGEKEFPEGSIGKLYGQVSTLSGLEVIRWTIRETSKEFFKVATEHLPQKLAETGVEALVLDMSLSFIELVPMSLGMPYVQVWNILHVDFTGATPPCGFSWPHETTPEAVARNIEGVKASVEILAQMMPGVIAHAEKVGLKIDWSDPGATVSKLAVVTQTPREFDFPGTPWPPQFHYAGPFHDSEGREPVPFAWEKLNGNPLIYASLGTLVNGQDHIYKTILEAVRRLPESQLVLSVGSNIDLDTLGPIPSNAIVIRKAPQIELLKHAALCITHAGLNTALESLAQGVPMVAIPLAYDQPGVASRIAHHGVGEFLEVDDLTADRLFELIRRVLTNPGYSDKALYFQRAIAETQGLELAADVVERALQTALDYERSAQNVNR
jgi:zeaxanthin glucosyltransferase